MAHAHYIVNNHAAKKKQTQEAITKKTLVIVNLKFASVVLFKVNVMNPDDIKEIQREFLKKNAENRTTLCTVREIVADQFESIASKVELEDIKVQDEDESDDDDFKGEVNV